MPDLKKLAEEYNSGKSLREISEDYNLSPVTVRRYLIKAGVSIRNKKEAAEAAMERGRLTSPILYRKRTQEEKDVISNAVKKRWEEMSPEDSEKFRKNAKDRWESQPEQEKALRQQKAGEALRKASVEGSKAEKALHKELLKAGYHVIIHQKGLIAGEKYEVDLFIPDLLIAIEIDGPQHFIPIYGQEHFNRTLKYDTIKNGALISRGICVLRVKYLSKHNSGVINKKIADLVIKEIEKIKNNFPPVENRLIELEIDNV
jgi:very-short-patch-repair endonuclease